MMQDYTIYHVCYKPCTVQFKNNQLLTTAT